MGTHLEIMEPAANAQSPGPGTDEANALEAALCAMTETLSSDFIDGRVGRHHNTFEHRSRVIRQLAAKLAIMRAQEVAPAL